MYVVGPLNKLVTFFGWLIARRNESLVVCLVSCVNYVNLMKFYFVKLVLEIFFLYGLFT